MKNKIMITADKDNTVSGIICKPFEVDITSIDSGLSALETERNSIDEAIKAESEKFQAALRENYSRLNIIKQDEENLIEVRNFLSAGNIQS
jgi:hypothetical protein